MSHSGFDVVIRILKRPGLKHTSGWAR